MFTWRPIFEEVAVRLLDYENRQDELLALLSRMDKAGISVVPLVDRQEDGQACPLAVMDPFTFFATFNRNTKLQTKLAALAYLKTEWALKSSLPLDVHGLPCLQPQNCWFISWSYKRKPEDVSHLWRLFRAALKDEWSAVPAAVYEVCLGIDSVGVSKLTTGLFWVAPSKFLPLPSTTDGYLRSLGLTPDASTKAGYDSLMQQVRQRLDSDFIKVSHQAWLYSEGALTETKPIAKEKAEHLWKLFQKANPEFVDFASPGDRFQTEEVDYKRKGLDKFTALGGRAEIERLLLAGDPDTALKLFKQSVALNIVSFHSWRTSLGEGNPKALGEVLQAFLDVTTVPYDGPDTLLPIFDAMERNDLKPAWDVISDLLWGLRPDDYFPVKISYYRTLANKCGIDLPSGKPTAIDFHKVIQFGRLIWDMVKDKQPHNWIDVQSFMWMVARVEEESETMVETSRRIWSYSPGEQARLWDSFANEGIAAIGWDPLGDLTNYASQQEVLEALKEEDHEREKPTNDAKACWEFCHVMRPGDLIVAKRGKGRVVGVGRVSSDYRYDEQRDEYFHLRDVEWLKTGDWEIPDKFATKTLTNLTPYPDMTRRTLETVGLPSLLRELGLAGSETSAPAVLAVAEPEAVIPFDEASALANIFLPEEQFRYIVDQLRRKKNLILQGAPGVGKTFVARTVAFALMGEMDESRLQLVQFHQSYGYEEFVQSLRPNGPGIYLPRAGVFTRFCDQARENPDKDYVFVIDEINRGNLSKILGELMMLIERDKRKEEYALPLAYSDPGETPFFVPPNVYLLGLMNTADRSIAMVDYALRRRFVFFTLKPQFGSDKFLRRLVDKGMDEALARKLIAGMDALNKEIESNRLDLGTGFCIGHSYFCPGADGEKLDASWIRSILDYEIRPLLEEYWMEAPDKVDEVMQRVLSALE